MSNINTLVSEMLEEGWGKKLALGAGLAALSLGGLVVKKTKKHDETIM